MFHMFIRNWSQVSLAEQDNTIWSYSWNSILNQITWRNDDSYKLLAVIFFQHFCDYLYGVVWQSSRSHGSEIWGGWSGQCRLHVCIDWGGHGRVLCCGRTKNKGSKLFEVENSHMTWYRSLINQLTMRITQVTWFLKQWNGYTLMMHIAEQSSNSTSEYIMEHHSVLAKRPWCPLDRVQWTTGLDTRTTISPVN